MLQTTVPLGVWKEELDRCTPLQGGTAEMEEIEVLKKGDNLGSARCESYSSRLEHSTCPAELHHQGRSQLLVTDAGSSFFPSAFSIQRSPDTFNDSAEKTDFRRPSKNCTSETGCFICCNQYSLNRLPKLLACQHVFCAVCLKLLLWNDGQAWTIVCPLCRKASSVLGGLICHLHNKEEALSRGLNREGSFLLDAQSGKQLACSTPDTSQDGPDDSSSNRMAAKRLLFLVMLLTLLVLITIPFLYPGLLKWTLCIAALWGLAVAGVLCWNPKWRCSGSHISDQARRTRCASPPPTK